MSGTRAGGLRARDKNRANYGMDFYRRIGEIGGKLSRSGGFASFERGKDGLTGRQRARIAGAKGGTISRRKKRI